MQYYVELCGIIIIIVPDFIKKQLLSLLGVVVSANLVVFLVNYFKKIYCVTTRINHIASRTSEPFSDIESN